nr:neuronal PAS domain-containing protein 4-like isoform X1 [Misgurnus anguillicaudatus]
MLKSMRSTKGASKARRDHINGEIRSLRALLPICAEDQERLSYLHSMSIICTFIRKSVLFTGVCENSRDLSLPHDDILQALPGFIVALTKDGKLVYVSENVSEYLGLSMVDVLQGDSFYDMIDTQDVESVKVILEDDGNVSEERSFVCRMVTSKAFRLQYGSCCSMLVSGRFQGGPPNSALFVGLCTPTVNRRRDFQFLSDSTYFQTLHKPDMNFAYAPHSVFFHLGYSAQELICQSWYGLLHPDDLTLAASLHKSLIVDDGDADVQMVVRLQCKDLSWVWIYIWANMEVGKQVIACKNYIIGETEAIYLKQKLYGNASMSSSQSVCGALLSQGPWGPGTRRSPKRQRERETPGDEPRRKSTRTSLDDRHPSVTHSDSRTEEPTFFCTPPYSPTSSHSSDFLSEGYDALDLLICDGTSALHHFSPSSPDVSSRAFALGSLSVGSHPYSASPCDLHTSVPDAHLVPGNRPVPNLCEGLSDCILHPDDLGSFLLHQTHDRAGVYPEYRESVSSPVRALTPESSPTAERCFHYNEIERDEISVLARQICSLASSFDVYGTQTSVQPNGALCWPHAPELLLDERVIDGVLHDVSVREHCVQGLPVASGSRVQALSMGTLVHFGSLESAVNTQNCCEINSELHQLNHCLYGDIREDGLTEESMY